MKNQRQYFRVEDHIELYYSSVLPTREADNAVHNRSLAKEDGKYFQVIKKTQVLNRDITQQIINIEKKFPRIAHCLKSINEKNTISLKCILSAESRPLCKANLSIGGIGFTSNSPIEEGTLLAIKMILHPSLIALELGARVVMCQQTVNENNPYRISTKFLDTTEEDKDLLSYHINEIQRKHIQQLKEAELVD